VEKLKKHWTPIIAISLHVAPLVKAAGWATDLVFLHAAGEATESLHGLHHSPLLPLAAELGSLDTPQAVDLGVRQVLKELIDELDIKRPPGHNNGGLYPYIVEDGRLLWLCDEHLKSYKTR